MINDEEGNSIKFKVANHGNFKVQYLLLELYAFTGAFIFASSTQKTKKDNTSHKISTKNGE